MQIQLTPEGCLCLLDHVYPGSPAHEALKRAVKFAGIAPQPEWYTIDIDLDIAEILLTIARAHCLSAVKTLDHAVRELNAQATNKSHLPVNILLPPGAYGCLVYYAVPGSPMRRALDQAKVITPGPGRSDWYVVDCDLELAKILLAMARNNCPSAVKKLEAAIVEFLSRAKQR